jgi:hypothetical protein
MSVREPQNLYTTAFNLCFVLEPLSLVLHTWWLGVHIILVQVLHSLQSLGDCDGKGLQGYTSAYTTRLIAEMLYIDKDGFCLAAL